MMKLLLLFLVIGLTKAEPTVTFSSNVPKVDVGKEFTVSCVVSGVYLDKNPYKFEFWRMAGKFLEVEYKPDIPVASGKNPSFVPHPMHDMSTANNEYGAFPRVDAKVNPSAEFNEEFWCRFIANSTSKNGPVDLESTHWVTNGQTKPPPTTTPAGLTVKFATNVTKVEANKPFLASCEIGNFWPEGNRTTYMVRFDRTDGPLGKYSYESKDASQKFALHFDLTLGLADGLKVAKPQRELNPLVPKFEIEVTPTAQSKPTDEYWCSFSLYNKGPEIASNKWKSNASFAVSVPSVAMLLVLVGVGSLVNRFVV